MAAPARAQAASTIIDELRAELSPIEEVAGARCLCDDHEVSVWVGITVDERRVRDSVYHAEDRISERHPQMLFDFRVVPLPEGKELEDYASEAETIFQRPAA